MVKFKLNSFAEVLLIGLAIFLTAAFGYLLTGFDYPFLWMGLFGTVIVGGCTAIVATPVVKNISLSISSMAFSITLIEMAMILLNGAGVGTQEKKLYLYGDYFTLQMMRYDGAMYVYRPDQKGRAAARTKDGVVVYDVVYRTNSDGLRVTANIDDTTEAPVSIFFGGSFTFGQGVTDEETLPSRYAAYATPQMNVMNFGLPGRGAHEMLRQIETGAVKNVLQGRKPSEIIYQALAGHHGRDSNRGMYGLGDDNKPVFVETPPGHQFVAWLRYVPFQKFQLAQYVFQKVLNQVSDLDASIRLHIAIVKAIKSELADSYGAQFTILFWDLDSDLSRKVQQAYTDSGFNVVTVSALISSEERKSLKFEGHPAASTYAAIAQPLWTYMKSN